MTLRTPLLAMLLLATGSSLFGGDFDSVLGAVKKGLPGKNTGAVACNLEANKEAVRELAAAAHQRGLIIKFLNASTADQANATIGAMRSMTVDFVIIIDKDAMFGVAGEKTKAYVAMLNSVGVPSLSLDEAAFKMGVTAAAGPKTQGKVIPNGNKPKAMGFAL